ncbi:unnamed protein product [Callosobruchus maculatus]|uniref:Uncharacterized protein n=1 Tax=Callosobruchus maculatus TaxID=64391 RepID=A0A653CGP3_CALMS|nr:unnamed protein product [Callosobruchus maculatus]
MLWSRHILVSFVMAPSNVIFTTTRIVDQRTEVHKTLKLLHNGLLTLFLDNYHALYLRS